MEKKIYTKVSCFKHSGIYHLLPIPKIVYEILPNSRHLTFEITAYHWTAYFTITFVLNISGTGTVDKD